MASARETDDYNADAWPDGAWGEFVNLHGSTDEIFRALKEMETGDERRKFALCIRIAYHLGQVSYCRHALDGRLSQEQHATITRATYDTQNYLLGLANTNREDAIRSVTALFGLRI